MKDVQAFVPAATQLWSDCKCVLDAVVQDGQPLFSAAPRLRIVREFVLNAVSRDGPALAASPEQLRCVRESVLHSVMQGGQAWAAAAERLRRDRDSCWMPACWTARHLRPRRNSCRATARSTGCRHAGRPGLGVRGEAAADSGQGRNQRVRDAGAYVPSRSGHVQHRHQRL